MIKVQVTVLAYTAGEMFPEHVGIPLGNGSGVSYYVMEIHYDNSKLKEGKHHHST